MRVLLDNNVPKVLRKLLSGHLTMHVYDLGWALIPDHLLLPKAESERYDVRVTNDKKMYNQQNNARRKIALVVLSINSRKRIREAHQLILEAVERSSPGSYESVLIPDPAK